MNEPLAQPPRPNFLDFSSSVYFTTDNSILSSPIHIISAIPPPANTASTRTPLQTYMPQHHIRTSSPPRPHPSDQLPTAELPTPLSSLSSTTVMPPPQDADPPPHHRPSLSPSRKRKRSD